MTWWRMAYRCIYCLSRQTYANGPSGEAHRRAPGVASVVSLRHFSLVEWQVKCAYVRVAVGSRSSRSGTSGAFAVFVPFRAHSEVQ